MNTDFEILLQIKTATENKNIYTVPVNYFENLATNILIKIKSQQNIYAVPVNYFNDLPTTVLQKIQQQKHSEVYSELQEIAPTLNNISKSNLYQLPENYFANLSYTSNKQPAKVVNIGFKKWYKYVAAAIVFAVSTVYFLNINKEDKQIAAQYKAAIKTDVTQAITTLQDADLNKVVETDKTNVATETIDDVAQINLPLFENVQEEVEQLSDEEIDLYLKNNNISTDEISNTNS